MSSRILITSRDIHVECSCGYSGDAEEFIDPEAYASGWDCPSCDTWRETDYSEPDPDDLRDRWLEEAR